MPILVSGSLVYDNIMNFPDSFKNHIMPDNIHILNVCFVVDRLERSWGGTAGNIAYTMKLLGAEPLVVSAVGADGSDYLDYLKKNGIDAANIKIDKKQSTASAYITTDADDNQITAFYNGPLANVDSLEAVKEKFELAIVSPTQKEAMQKHMHECATFGAKAMFDPGQQITAFTGEELQKMLSQAHFVIGNDYEIKLLEERTGWDANEILKNAKVLIVTLGERGSIIKTAEGEEVKVGSCPPLSFDDPTGAGDAYRAGFLVGFERGYNWKMCGQMGAVAASYAIETFGTQAHNFTKKEFCERYKKAFGEELKLE
ncbi:carbohydrate kinase family protein [Patescibacteria group bacterium]|nr:MAG: carbohydrate kinase family protein [Patescibacteria group bacterium]